MCTLIALFDVHPGTPLVLALNRDEFLERPTTSVHRWTDAAIVAGRDDESGGTWFAVGDSVVAGITNHRRGNSSPRGGRSRGELVVRAATAKSGDEVATWLMAEDPEAFGGFHLLVCDGTTLRCFTNADGAMREERAGPGVHVLGNFGLDDVDDPVVATVGAAARSLLADKPDDDALTAGLQSILRRHGEGWPCVHFGPFGTRMSALLSWPIDRPRLLVTEGAACEAEWRDESGLLTPA